MYIKRKRTTISCDNQYRTTSILAAASKIMEHSVLYVVFLQFFWLVMMQKFMSWPKWKYAFQGNHIDMSSVA